MSFLSRFSRMSIEHIITIIKKRWLLFVVLIVFIVVKIPHLSYPYYWDESWPYAPAIKAMYDHGISLMPDAVDAELSRGHPLFFHAIGAIWMHIFGQGHVAMHSFALLISVLFLVIVYEAGLKLYNNKVAICAILLVSTQLFFYMQSAMVLMEVLVAFLSFLSLYYYVTRRYLLTVLTLSALFYTKESGLITGFIIGCDALFHLFNKNTTTKEKLVKLTTIAVPCVLIGIFFLVQKHIRGWYAFPLYESIVEKKWDPFWYKFRMGSLWDAFCRDLRHWQYLVLVPLSIIVTIKTRKVRYLIILLPIIMVYYLVNDARAAKVMPSLYFFITFLLALAVTAIISTNKNDYPKPEQRKFIILCLAYSFAFLIFSQLNFYTPRYIHTSIIPQLFLLAVFSEKMTENSFKILYVPVLAIMLIVSYFAFKENDSYGDLDLGAFDGMTIQQKEVDFFEHNQYYNKNISTASFLTSEHLKTPATGFLRGSRNFPKVQWPITDTTDFVIFNDIEPDGRYAEMSANKSYRLAYRYAQGKVWTEIYQRITKP